MKIGLYLNNQQFLSADMDGALQEQYLMVHAARDRGWNSLLTGQHFLNEGNNKQLEMVPFLTRLMAEAGEMTTGMGIFILTLHNPVYVAETIASMDVIAGGNFIFGIGLGYRELEFDAFGIRKGERVQRFEQSLTLIKQLWSGETVSFDSDWCRLDKVTMNLRPVQQPHPPLWFAAGNETAIRRAARLGDTWFCNPLTPIGEFKTQLAVYRDELQQQGKSWPRELPLFREIYVARDRATALKIAGPWLQGKYQAYARWGINKDKTEVDIEALAAGRFILGSPEECYEQLRPYCELGINHFIFRLHWPGMPVADALAGIRLLSDELLPALRASGR
jgi:alkanesulfonate monooxygenase SsuD/methylene tetrahydromethanopterin reductase-like flavin-dependent oxidoreductase (luciferase family)